MSEQATGYLPRVAHPETIAFVERFADFRTYGGGQQARLRVADGVVLEAIDGWGGHEALVAKLALKLEEHLKGLAL